MTLFGQNITITIHNTFNEAYCLICPHNFRISEKLKKIFNHYKKVVTLSD